MDPENLAGAFERIGDLVFRVGLGVAVLAVVSFLFILSVKRRLLSRHQLGPMTDLLTSVSAQLPLVIDRAGYSNESLSLRGDSWSLDTLSSWRLVRGQRLVCGWDWKNAQECLYDLPGAQISGISWQSDAQVDPDFAISNGLVVLSK